ncbi:MAG TPA: DUF4440 domain-containing protein [Sporichthya sp.]|nr:DUF4440 domain-containing protein [Sporichthya sp.]
MSDSDFDRLIEQSHEVWREFITGNAGPAEQLYSRRDDVTVANPFGGIARGWAEVSQRLTAAAANWRNGEVRGFDTVQSTVSGDFAYLVEVERYTGELGGGPAGEVDLRVTSVFRREDGEWKIVHRHADTRTGPQRPESLMQSGSG